MPYLPVDSVKKMRNELKKRFPEYKMSVRSENYTSVHVTFRSGPIQLMNDPSKKYEPVNHFYINEHYSGESEKVLEGVYNIVNGGNGIEVMDGDYGAVPNWYVRISIGDWERPYIVK